MKHRLLINCLLSVAIVCTPLSLRAAMVDTPTMLNQGERSAQVELVETYLAREEVRLQLESMGVDPVLASERLASLTDAQLQQLSLNIQDAPAGGALGVVVAVLVIILLLEILGITNMSNKV